MFWKSIVVLSVGGVLLACAPCEAQTPASAPESPVPSFRSATCNAFCDLFTAVKDGFPSTPPAVVQPGASAAAEAATAKPKKFVRRRTGSIVARTAETRNGDEFRIYASSDVTGFYNLEGRSVSLGLNGSRSQSLARKTLAGAGLKFDEQPLDTDNAFDALSIGSIQAVAVSGRRAYAMMDGIPARFGVHRIQIPDHKALVSGRAEHRKIALLSSPAAK